MGLPAALILTVHLFAVSAAALACSADSAQPAKFARVDANGDITLADGTRLRLVGLAWPEAWRQHERDALVHRLNAALADARMTFQTAGELDRWGRLPAYVFLQEPASGTGPELAPFWLTAGIVEAGLAAAWPDVELGGCWTTLAAHERAARVARVGIWAEQGAWSGRWNGRHAESEDVGRKITIIARVKAVKRGRRVWFINLEGAAARDVSIMIAARAIPRFQIAGLLPETLEGRTVALRTVVAAASRPNGIVPRVIIERLEQLERLD